MELARIANLTIQSHRSSSISLYDASTGIKLTPLRTTLHNKAQVLFFPNLWRGNFLIRADDKEIKFEIDKTGTDNLSGEISIKTSVRIGLTKNVRKPIKFKDKYISLLNNLGWNETIRSSDKFTAVCDYLSVESQKEINRKAIVIPTPVPGITKVPNDLKLKHPSVCMIQNHQIKQKSEALLQFIKVIKKTPKITYYISKGLPENRNNTNYKKVINGLKPLNNVIFVDVNHQNKFDYLYSTDLYVLASGIDCTPATIIEAYLTARPVIASRVGGVPEMIINGKTGWCLDNQDTSAWVDKINELAFDKRKLKQMGQTGKEFANNTYSFAKISKLIYDQIR